MADQHRPGLGPDRRSLRAPTLPEALNKYRRHSFMVGADRSALATAANRKARSAGLEVRHFAACEPQVPQGSLYWNPKLFPFGCGAADLAAHLAAFLSQITPFKGDASEQLKWIRFLGVMLFRPWSRLVRKSPQEVRKTSINVDHQWTPSDTIRAGQRPYGGQMRRSERRPESRLHRGCRRFEPGRAHVTMKLRQWI